MTFSFISILSFTLLGIVFWEKISVGAIPTQAPPGPSSVSPFKPEPAPTYYPHTAYLNANSYVDGVPYGVVYNGDSRPGGNGYFDLIPSYGGALGIALQVFAKFVSLIMGGGAILLLGGFFTSLVCHFTPLCTITFHGLNVFDKDTMRTLLNPDKISETAAIVEDAIDKYKRMQRSMRR